MELLQGDRCTDAEMSDMRGNEKRLLVPRLRFPEFRDAGKWKVTTLGECLDYRQPTDYLVSNTNYSDTYDTPVLTAGKTFVLGYTNEEHGIFSEELPVIIFDDFTTATQFVDFPFKAKSSAMKILLAQNEVNIRFIYELMQMISYEVGVHERHWISKFSSMQVLVPRLEEQQKIADCLSSLDELIAAETQKLDTLKTHKKGLMQQLFPREEETVPRLRFPEFQDAGKWESDLIGNIFDTTSGGTPSRSIKEYWDGGIPWITTSLVNFSIITRADEFISEAGLKNSAAKVFPQGTVIIAMYGQGKTRGQVALLAIEAATNQACAAILPRKELEPKFVFLNLAGRYEEIRQLSNSGGQENLSQELIREFPFSYPSNPAEQRMIVVCLTSIDNVIDAQSRKIEALRSHKNGLVQQLFPVFDEALA